MGPYQECVICTIYPENEYGCVQGEPCPYAVMGEHDEPEKSDESPNE
jgi:hypothetical protein